MQRSTKYLRKITLTNVTNFNFCEVRVPQSQKLTQAIEAMEIMAGSKGIKLCKVNDFKQAQFLIEQAIKRN